MLAAIPWCSFLKAIIFINYNDTERDEERKEIALIWTPQKGNRGYWDLRVPYHLGPTASGFFFIWAVRILPQTVRNLPHTITGSSSVKKIHVVFTQCALIPSPKNICAFLRALDMTIPKPNPMIISGFQ